MKKYVAIFSLLLVAAILFAQCKASECTYKPRSAKQATVWMKKR
jgi:hypothetical protein